MASRKADKEAARQRRLEAEREAAAGRQRTRRLQILGGGIVAVIAVVVVVIIVAGGGSSKKAVKLTSQAARTNAAAVTKLLSGIPQSGSTLGNPKAPVTFTEFGDLQCPVCAEFATNGTESSLISNEVRTGKVKLVYKSLETATEQSPNSSLWSVQQAGTYAAGVQGKAWDYIELFYREQGAEDSGYATTAFEQGIAKQVPGLNYAEWNKDRTSSAYAAQVIQEGNEAGSLGINATPGLIAVGPKSQTAPQQGLIPYSKVQSMIKSVS